jgi:acetyl esterase/lipase
VSAHHAGGAFVAGDALMCAATFKRWMRSLAARGLRTRVLCISYPLAPEQPFPAAVASTAAAFAWLGQQHTSFIAVGDSAGEHAYVRMCVVAGAEACCRDS